MTPKEREKMLWDKIEDLNDKLDKLLELLGGKDGKAKAPKRK